MPSNNSRSSGMPAKLRLKIANERNNSQYKAKLISPNENYKFYLVNSSEVSKFVFDKLLVIMRTLMKSMYEKSSWGWDEQEKLAEWMHHKTKIILVTKDDQLHDDQSKTITCSTLPHRDKEIIGFMCLRFERGADKNESALYVYELHIDTDYQRQGLGGELIEMAKTIASEAKVDKIMLTVFRSNKLAIKFYQSHKFITDRSSPPDNEADYVILSFKIPKS